MSILPNSQQPRTVGIDWASRLIPGLALPVNGMRKRPQSVQSIAENYSGFAAKAGVPSTAATNSKALPFILSPDHWHPRWAASGLKSMSVDFAMVVLNWMFVGVAILCIQINFPEAGLFEVGRQALSPLLLLSVAVLNASLITLWGESSGLYLVADLREQVRPLATATLGSTVLLMVAFSLQSAPTISLAIIACGAVLNFGALLMWRWQEGRRCQTPAAALRNVLIVGAGDVGQRIADHVKSHPESGRTVCGFLDDHRPLGEGVLGRVSNLAMVARAGFVDEVILAIPHDRDRTRWVVFEARRLRLDVEMVLDIFNCPVSGIEQVGGFPVVCLHAELLPAGALRVKRCVDVIGATFALALLAPLLAMIAILVQADSKGAALYAAQRAGRKGKPFRCYKFRTMVDNADSLKETLRVDNQRSGPFFKIADDPRITRTGRFLRRYSLDELPQFWNVLRGDMSLVGPRPHPLDDFAGYGVDHLARLDVTPGITGLWQVTARRDPSFQKGIDLDREYIRNWSLGLDMKILLRTVLAVMSGSGE